MRRIVLALVGLVVSATACGDAGLVEKVTLENPYEYDVIAEVSGDGSGWLNLGGLARESEETIQHVIDMGDRWIFRFRYRHDHVPPVEVSLSRSELAAAGWRVKVPESLAEVLRKRGEPPSEKGG